MITWDEKKRKQVIKDHGVDLAKVGDIFDDPFAIHEADQGHGNFEERWLTIGNVRIRIACGHLHFPRR